MRRTVDLLREEARARLFFVVLAQSALGTGAGYVALLLVAYDRFESAWAISLVLLADLVAPMVLGPVFGAAADRWSRRACMVVADLVRALAFAGIALVSGFEATIALALLAGAGTALFTPASLAALPSLVSRERLPVATSLYGAITDVGLAVGPALAALLLVLGDAETVLLVNAGTFALSALVLARLDFGHAPAREEGEEQPPGVVRALFADAIEGTRTIGRVAGLPTILIGSAAALFFGGLVNVSELPFVTQDLDASDAAFSVLVAVAGAGIALGSLMGASGGSSERLRDRYLLGLLVMGAGFLASGLAPVYGFVVVTFALAGFGNGLMLVHERLIIQETVPDALTGRIFGTKDAFTAWAFGISFLVAGALVTEFGARTVMVTSGAGVLLVTAVAAWNLLSPRRRQEVAG